MKYLYLLLDIGSLSIPFLYSFHPRLKFHKLWPYLFPSIIMTMFIFIPWDIIFTENKFWGFNNDYLSGLYFVNLPIEEWLFFICIPYACIFTHEAFKIIAPGFLSQKQTPCSIDMVSNVHFHNYKHCKL